MQYNVNGTLFGKTDKGLDLKNRSFRYGDGVFETMRLINGKVPLYNFHIERLVRGMKTLKIEIPSYFNLHYLRNEISKTIETLPISEKKNARIRLWVWREGEGNYTPTSNLPDFAIEVTPLMDSVFLLNDLGLTVGIYTAIPLHYNILSNIKNNNALPYVMAAIHAKRELWDDALMLNTDGNVAEASASNVFWIKDEQIFTPPLQSACVAGVMRHFLMETWAQSGKQVIEKTLDIDSLRHADEVFLTNALQGIKWVENFEDKIYTNEQVYRIFDALKSRIKNM